MDNTIPFWKRYMYNTIPFWKRYMYNTIPFWKRYMSAPLWREINILDGTEHGHNAIGIKKKVQICCRTAAFEVYI